MQKQTLTPAGWMQLATEAYQLAALVAEQTPDKIVARRGENPLDPMYTIIGHLNNAAMMADWMAGNKQRKPPPTPKPKKKLLTMKGLERATDDGILDLYNQLESEAQKRKLIG